MVRNYNYDTQRIKQLCKQGRDLFIAGKYVDGVKKYETALNLAKNISEQTNEVEDYISETKVMTHVADDYSKYGLLEDEAFDLYAKVLSVRKTLLNDNDPLLANAYLKLGIYYTRLLQNPQLAFKYFSLCESVLKKNPKTEDILLRYVFYYNNVAIFFKCVGNKEQAKEYYKKALVILDKLNKEGSYYEKEISVLLKNIEYLKENE